MSPTNGTGAMWDPENSPSELRKRGQTGGMIDNDQLYESEERARRVSRWRITVPKNRALLVGCVAALLVLCSLAYRLVRPRESWERCVVDLPVPFKATLPLQFPKPAEKQHARKVPNVVHFVYGYRSETEALTFLNFVSVTSALAMLTPDQVMFHTPQEPVGFFWELLKPHVTLMDSRRFDTIFGRPTSDYAHKSDIVRLEALLEHGGIYLDIDVITLRPFSDLMDFDMVMGQEGKDAGTVGLCNGVMVSAPNSTFIRKWYDAYQTFNQSNWNFHSVILPNVMAKANPEHIHRLPYTAFHWPLWDKEGMDLMMNSFDYNYSENKAVHMWNHGLKRSPYSTFAMPWCFECHSTLVSMLRHYVPDPLFSVIMPCYNQSMYIEEALRSVAMQTFPSWEIIVIDDKSPDGCGRAAKAFADEGGLGPDGAARLKVIRNDDNRGLSESRNIGIRAARGVWICALDADDRLGPSYFAAAAEAMSSEGNLELIYSDQDFFEGSSYRWKVPEFTTETVMTEGPLPVMSLYLRSVWEKVGGYSSALPWGNEDYDFWMKLLVRSVTYKKLPGVHVYYRWKDQSMMRQGKPFEEEEHAMMRTRYPFVYHPSKLLRDHKLVMHMSAETSARLEKKMVSNVVTSTDKAHITFWLALKDMQEGNYRGAMARIESLFGVEDLHWQPRFYYALSACHVPESRVRGLKLLEELGNPYPSLHRTREFQRRYAECRRKAAISLQSPLAWG